MKILIDMNLSPDWATYLQEAGHEAVFWSTVGASNAPDTSILEYAIAHQMVILTRDVDFGMMVVASGGNSPSVVQLRTDRTMPAQLGSQVKLLLVNVEDKLRSGALLTVDGHKTRVRLL